MFFSCLTDGAKSKLRLRIGVFWLERLRNRIQKMVPLGLRPILFFFLLLLSTINSKRTMYPHLYVDNTPLYISDLSFCNNMFYMQYWCQQLLKGFSYTLILDLCVCRILSQPSPKALYWPSWSQESPTCLWHSRQVTQPCTTRSTRADPV